MSAKRNRAGLLADIIARNDHDHCMALRSAWADTQEIDLSHVVILGITNPGILQKFLEKKLAGIKTVKVQKNGTVIVSVLTETIAAGVIDLLNGRDFSTGQHARPFSSKKVRAYPVPPKVGIDDIDFETQSKFKVRAFVSEGFTGKYIIAGNGDMIFAYRRRSERDKYRPDKKSSPGDRDFWTLVYVYKNGTIGKKETGRFESDLLNKHLEFKAGKEIDLIRKNTSEVTYRVVDNGKERRVAASLLGEIEYHAQFRFARGSDKPDDRSSLSGWTDRPGQWSPNNGGTLNKQFLAESFAIDHGFLDPDTRTIEQTHGKTVGFAKGTKFHGKGKEKYVFEARDSLEDLCSPEKVAREIRIEKLMQEMERDTKEPAEQKRELKSAPQVKFAVPKKEFLPTDKMKERFFTPPAKKEPPRMLIDRPNLAPGKKYHFVFEDYKEE